MKVAIVNDLAVACEALRRVVASDASLEIAWIARDGDEAVAKARVARPDLILMDLLMPRMDGVAATREIMRAAPCPILVVTAIPWCEEFAYRGLLQSAIAKGLAKVLPSGRGATSEEAATDGTMRWVAIAVASVAFSLMHVTALPESSRGAALVTLWTVSIVLGWLYERTGRLAAPVAAHGLFNAINLVLALGSA